MRIVVSIQREPDDVPITPAYGRQTIKRLATECVRLLGEWPESKWMTQTAQVARPRIPR